jgi:hypothetical protein
MIGDLFDSGAEDSRDIVRGSMERVRGILYENESVLNVLRENESRVCYVEVTTSELVELSELECFVDSHRHSKAVAFAKRWSDDVDVLVRIEDYEDVCVELKEVIFTGEITNEVVRNFAQSFRSDMYATFDPLAEEHDEPHLSVEPW